MKKDIKSLSYDELSAELKAMGEPSFRAKQIYAWLHQRTAADFSQMTDLSKGLREKLGEAFYITAPKILKKQVSAVDGTVNTHEVAEALSK